jgi:pyridoxal 5'-phosphate synthase pdxT subunit
VTVGILALQGDVAEHEAAFGDLGVSTRRVGAPLDLDGLRGIVLPGGESTTLSLLLDSSGLFEPLAAALRAGLPAFGTCAGLVLLATGVVDGRDDQRTFGVLDCTVRRNGYGRQRRSFETILAAPGLGGGDGLPAVFIRAPRIEAVGPSVEVVATLANGDGAADPVVLRQGPLLAAAFHPELTADRRLHRLFVSLVATPRSGGSERAATGNIARRR